MDMVLDMFLDMELDMELLSHLFEMDSSMDMDMGMDMDTLDTRVDTGWGNFYLFIYDLCLCSLMLVLPSPVF